MALTGAVVYGYQVKQSITLVFSCLTLTWHLGDAVSVNVLHVDTPLLQLSFRCLACILDSGKWNVAMGKSKRCLPTFCYISAQEW